MWRVVVQRQHPTVVDWQDNHTPGALDVPVGKTVALLEAPHSEDAAIDAALRQLGMDVTMEPNGTSYLVTTQRIQ